ncbi:MAG: PUA domain-containing protein [Sulfolobales archaeon]
MKLNYLSKRALRELVVILRERFNLTNEYEKIVLAELSSGEKHVRFYIGIGEVEKIPLAIEIEELIIPALHALNKNIMSIPYVRIDSGAVSRILNGADVMAPGITECTSFERDSIVGVREPERNLFISVGIALMSCDEIKSLKKGKAVRNLHYAGDKIWRELLEILKRISA